MRVLFVIGCRPEIIKCFPVYKALKDNGHSVVVYYTKQNYTKELSDDIFDDFAYKKSDIKNSIPKSFKSDVILVQGDTWSTLRGAMLAKSTGVKLGHIEAGLRSHDDRMAEEKIRMIVDEVADFNFCTTVFAKNNITDEFGTKSYVVGNTLYDLMKDQIRDTAEHILVTLHRPETVDTEFILIETLQAVNQIAKDHEKQAYFSVHPRTLDKIKRFGIDIDIKFSKHIIPMKPLSYVKFQEKLRKSFIVITDSGGIQEEAAILQIPCVTTRFSTERPETVMTGLNKVCGNDMENIVFAAEDVLKEWQRGKFKKVDYGDGTAGEKIVKILERKL